MGFYTDIEQIYSSLNGASSGAELKNSISECRKLTKQYFSEKLELFEQLNRISTEPTQAYFPEMHEKVKVQALEECKKSILHYLGALKNEYGNNLIGNSLDEIIQHEESQVLEFKSTLCWDVKNSKADKKMMGEIIMKSISAFSNSEGGILLIGVQDDKEILGLNYDYHTFNNGLGSRDDFELHLTTLIINCFSKSFAKDNLSIEFPKIEGKEICLIRIKKGDAPYTVKITDKGGQAKEKFFIRVNNSSRDIDSLLEFAKYIKRRFPTWN